MSVRAQILTGFIGMMAGGAGALLASAFAQHDARGARPEGHSAAIPLRVEPAAPSPADDDALATMEQRLRAVEARGNRPPPDIETQAVVEPPPEPEGAEQQIAAHRAAIEAHQREPRDNGWASAAEARLTESLGRTPTRGELVQTDCRSTTCTAEVEWPNYSTATDAYPSVLHELGFDCAREVVLPPPEDTEASYRATVIYDCRDSRAENVRASVLRSF